MKKLCAALLRSFRGQHSEKMKGSAPGNWDPREGQQPFRPNPNGVGDRTTTLRRLLIGAASIGSRATCHHFSACVFPILHHASQKNMNVQNQMRKRPTKHEIFSNSICFIFSIQSEAIPRERVKHFFEQRNKIILFPVRL